MIFDIKEFKKVFKPLKDRCPNDYYFVMNLITKGADIKRTEKPPSTSTENYNINDLILIEKVTKKLLHHLDLGQLRGPYDLTDLPKFKYRVHYSPISAKLKASGKAMMIVDESAPLGNSINSAIKKEDKHVQYIDFKALCKLLKRVGNRGWLWVVDAVDAYYRIPIQKRFQHLFGIKWLNKVLIYKCLSFGLSTAPSIYNRFADLILWACTYWGKKLYENIDENEFDILHYLDDFFGGHINYDDANEQMKFLVKMFERLNIPTNPKKCVGPAQILDILGWSCCTIPTVRIGLAEKKRLKYIAFLTKLLNKNQANFKQFEKAIGYTRHTCRIYLEGNKFVRGLEKQKFAIQANISDTSNRISKFTKFNLSPESKFDLKIWLQLYNDAKYHYTDIDNILRPKNMKKIKIFTDASTSYGAGGISSSKQIYHLPWILTNIFSKLSKNNLLEPSKQPIIYLELFALVLMTSLFGKTWGNKFVHFYCDNTTVVSAVNSGTLDFASKNYYPKANLLKLLARLALKYNFHFKCHHLKGEKNKIADILSREDDTLRNMVYNKVNKNHFIPTKMAQKIVECTCVNYFSINCLI